MQPWSPLLSRFDDGQGTDSGPNQTKMKNLSSSGRMRFDSSLKRRLPDSSRRDEISGLGSIGCQLLELV